PDTVQRVVRAIDHDPVLLELLHALAKADSLATGPGVWTEWKAGLLVELTGRCRQVMHGNGFARPEPLDDSQRLLAESVCAANRAEVLVSAEENVATITVAVPPGEELLAATAGVLALQSLEVHTASLHTHAGVWVGLFTASPRFGTPPDPALLREKVVRAVNGRLALADSLASKERDYGESMAVQAAPRVLWFDDETAGEDTVLLELRASDRIGLLYRVAGALSSCGAHVIWARVATLGSSCVDSFAIRSDGQAGPEWRRRVEQAVLTAARG
ncbi:MAG: [protein-PII] uridylyltransferase, partial [Haloechinothrix sp.]